MQRTTIWIDHRKAYIIENNDEASFRSFQLEDVTPESKDYQRKFYHQLAKELKTPSCLVVFGPGLAKEEFRNHCEDHHPQLAKAILELKTMKDHPTKAEIIKASMDFYRHHLNWVAHN